MVAAIARRAARAAALVSLGAGALVAMLVALGAAAAWPAPAATPPPSASAPPTIDAAPQVGIVDLCDPGTWTTPSGGGVADTDFTWYRDSTANPVYESHDGSVDSYTPVAADIGHRLICRETVNDPNGGATATADSNPSAVVTPTATLTLTQFSRDLAGSIGEPVAGVTVSLALVRPAADGSTPQTVARATATTISDGTWSASLVPPAGAPPDGFGAPGDQLVTLYAPPAGAPGTLTPGPLTYAEDSGFTSPGSFFEGPGTQIAADGSAVANADVTGPDCSALRFIVDGGPLATGAAGGDPCTTRPASALTDADHVQAALSGPYSDGTTTGLLTTVSDAGLLGTGANGPPTCAANLVTSDVTCNGLSGAGFTLERYGGPRVTLAIAPQDTGASVHQGDAVLPGLRSGDIVALRESGAAAGRALSVLHVATLRVDLNAAGEESGVCEPGKAFSGGAVCPASGTFPTGLGADTGLLDDLSGGSTLLTLPGLSSLTPADGASVPHGGFPAVAAVSGDGTPAQSDAQALAETAAVTLRLVPHGGPGPSYTRALVLKTGSSGPQAAAQVSGVGLGSYDATWTLTDDHGDTVAYTDSFSVHAGAATTLPGVATGTVDGRHPPRWVIALARCLARRAGHRPRHRAGCHATVPARAVRTVSIRLTRSARDYADGHARVHGGHARVFVAQRRVIVPGRYRLLVRLARRRRAVLAGWRLTL